MSPAGLGVALCWDKGPCRDPALTRKVGLGRDVSGVAALCRDAPLAGGGGGVKKWVKSIDINPTIAHRTVRYLALFTSGSLAGRSGGQ